MTKSHGVSRRDFLKLGTVGAAAAGLSAASLTTAFAAEAEKAEAGATETVAEETGSVSGAVSTNDTVLTLGDQLPKWSFMVAPDPIPEDQITEVIEDDVIVIGAGMAGMATAVSAAQNGASVTLFSASSGPISRGGSNFAANSKVMEELGVEPFDPEYFFYHELRAASFDVDERKWFRGYNNSEEAMNWMIDIGRDAGLEVILERDNAFDKGPAWAHAFSTLGDSSMVSTGQQGAVEALEALGKELGVTFVYDTKAEQLIKDGDRVTGVVASKTSDGSYVQFNGKYIVMATGDFSANREMLAAFAPHEVVEYVGYESAPVDYNTGFAMNSIYGGDGQKMGLWAGAAWQRCVNAPMWQGAWGGSHNPLGFHWGLNVNTLGERYQREDVSAPYSAHQLLHQPGNIAWGIWTSNYPQTVIDRGYEWYAFGSDYTLPPKTAEELIESWDKAAEEGGAYKKADTLDELAEMIEVSAETLKATVARYNELCEAGQDTDFYKNKDFMIKIEEEGPFYATQNTCTFMTIMGGLRTSLYMEVCDADDKPIPGLFNVGIMVGDTYSNQYNFAIPGHNYGINCLTYGYLLGRDLATGFFEGKEAPAETKAEEKADAKDEAEGKKEDAEVQEKADEATGNEDKPAEEAAPAADAKADDKAATDDKAADAPTEEEAGVDCSPCHGDAHKPGDENPHGY